jgi:hypothetical protein
MPDNQSILYAWRRLVFCLELEWLAAALESAVLLAGAIVERFAVLFTLLNHLEFEATALTNVDLAQLHVVAACHLLTSAQTRLPVTERMFQYAVNRISHRGPLVKSGKPRQGAAATN